MGTALKVKHDGTIPQSEYNRLAKLVASSQRYGIGWGEINSQKKMRGRNVWWFSCSGHGGYVAITTPNNPNNPVIPEGYKPLWTYGDGTAVYTFEEDCDWAVLDYWNDDVCKFFSKHIGGENMTEAKTRFYATKTLATWNPQYLRPEDKAVALIFLHEQMGKAQEAVEDMVNQGRAKEDMEYYIYRVEEVEHKIKLVMNLEHRKVARELRTIMENHSFELHIVGDSFGEFETDMLKRLIGNAPDMTEAEVFHTCRLITSWASDAQHVISKGPGHVAHDGLNAMKRELIELANRLNGNEEGTRMVMGGKYSHENYDLEKAFKKKYTGNF